MDKIIKYRRIVRALMEEINAIAPTTTTVENQIIMDDKQGHYLLYSVGWEGMRWVYGSYVHIDVKPDGKIWLQHDGTSLKIAEELQDRGIPKKDIVIGFQPPHARALMEGYAVA